MINTNPVPLSPQEVKRIQSWLLQQEAKDFQNIIKARIAQMQVESSGLLMEGIGGNPNNIQEAQQIAAQAAIMTAFLELMDEYASSDKGFYRTEFTYA